MPAHQLTAAVFFVLLVLCSVLCHLCHAGRSRATSPLELDFTSEPTSQFVTFDGSKTVLKCAANVRAANVTWLFNNQDMDEKSFHGVVKKNRNRLVVRLPQLMDLDGDALSPETAAKMLLMEQTMHALDGVIQCIISLNGEAMISKPARLLVAKISPFPMLMENETVSVFEDNVAVIKCKPPHSVPPAVTEFSFKGNIIDKTFERYHIMPSGDLQIFDVRAEDVGVYECIAHNPLLRVRRRSSNPVTLKVKGKKSARNGRNTLLKFSVTPQPSVDPVLGSNLTLECAATAATPPQVTWSRLESGLPARNKFSIVGGNLILHEVTRAEAGTYLCQYADHNTGTLLEAKSEVTVHEPPKAKTIQSLTPDGVAIGCEMKGNPPPDRSWVLNGRLLNEQEHEPGISVMRSSGDRLLINKNRFPSGIVQCFASNSLGTTFDTARIETGMQEMPSVNAEPPKEEISHLPIDDYPVMESRPSDSGPKHSKRKPENKMDTPSKPEVHRLSDDSVMVRWVVQTSAEGMGIKFFKVQYKEIGGPEGRKSEIKTVDEEIAGHIVSHSVSGLKSGAKYRFRIAAVYTNDDNRVGPFSSAFTLLKNPPVKKPKQGPIIVSATAASPTAITVNWEYNPPADVLIEGFYIFYRDTSSAGQYFTETIHGSNVRSHIVTHLLPEISYDLKMQAFTAAGPSDFSNIVTNKTLPNPNVPSTSSTEGPKILVPVSKSHYDHVVYIVGGTILVLILVFVVCIVLCVGRLKQPAQASMVASKNLKNAKERHPKAHSLHNLNHPSHFSKLDYGNPYGNYAKSNGLNGSLAKSVNGLAVKSAISSGFVFRDNTEPEKNEIRIRVNPLTDDITVGFEGRSRTLSSTTFIGSRSHSTRDLLRRTSSISHHNLHNNGSGIPAAGDVANNNVVSNESNHVTVSTTDRRKKVGDEVHPNYYGVKINHRSTSFTRLNGTLERKKRSRTDLLSFEQTATTKVNNDTLVSTRCGSETTSTANGQLVIMQSSC